MKVVLCEDVENLGSIGEEVSVARGYARNYLFPRKLAVDIESGSAKHLEHEMRIIRRREEARRNELKNVVGSLEKLKVEITQRAGTEGRLFGSVTSLHIAQALADLGHKVDRKKIKLKEPIKSLGNHEVALQLMSGVTGTLTVTVIGEVIEESAEPDAELEAAEAADRAEEARERAEETGAEYVEETAAPVSAKASEPTEAAAEDADDDFEMVEPIVNKKPATEDESE